ncbi:uncharacterized protein K02A2.6-like [Ostrea edulis]|uniref:uncharacterized protein K02A2.6-like n=1 Tax=Ostrea edulis TaxID=37623 RepID=UPI0024AEEB9B|nr:uncharacterized protein K02A2.6-like [Ostrea edulis]
MKVVESGIPMERVATGILGELPRTDQGNRYTCILVVYDYFTKWTESFATPNMEAQPVAKILVEEVFAKFGLSRILHSDQGRQYESHLFKEPCALLHIEKTRTSPYHPQTDGMVERFNETLATMLSAYVNDHQTNWDEFLPHVMQAYRSAVHKTTGCTPNFLMLGRETSTPLDLMYELPGELKVTPQNQWVWELQERLEKALKIVTMPKTKITVNKGRKCPFCYYRFIRDEELAKHIAECSKGLLFCINCNFSSTTPKNLRRHLKRQHDIGEDNGSEVGAVRSKAPCESHESDTESWVRQDPGDLQGVLPEDISDSESDNGDMGEEKSKKTPPSNGDSQIEEGRLFQKPTRSIPVLSLPSCCCCRRCVL